MANQFRDTAGGQQCSSKAIAIISGLTENVLELEIEEMVG
jgi:hypothetical protein